MYTFPSNLTYKGRTLSDRTEWSELPPTHLFFFLLLLYIYLLGVSCLTSSHTEFITRKKMEKKGIDMQSSSMYMRVSLFNVRTTDCR